MPPTPSEWGGQGVTQGSHPAASDGRVLAEQANDV